MKLSTGSVLVLAALSLQVVQEGAAQAASSTPAQPQVTAQQGQTAEQQKKDMQECYDIAKAKTGIDPQALTGLMGKGKSASGAASQASDSVTGAAGSAVSATQKAAGQPQSGQTNTAATDQPASAAGSAASSSASTKMDLFGAANQGCLEARGYLIKGSEAPAAAQPPPQ